MKSNTSRRNPSTSYFDTLRAEFDALTQQLADAETAANEAQTEADTKRRAYHELEQRSHSTHWSVTEQRLYREKNQLEATAWRLQQELVPLREEHARLARMVKAPLQLEQARVEMAALTDRRTALADEITKAKTLHAQLDARIETVEKQIACDTQSTANRLMNAGELTAIPAALATQHAELTATCHTREEGHAASRSCKPSTMPCRIRFDGRAIPVVARRPSWPRSNCGSSCRRSSASLPRRPWRRTGPAIRGSRAITRSRSPRMQSRRRMPRSTLNSRPAERVKTLASARHSAFIDLSQPQELRR